MSFYAWIIKAVSAAGLLIVSVVAVDLVRGTNLVQSKVDALYTAGHKVEIFSLKGTPKITPKILMAPEIDAASGGIALSLLAGVIMLMKEKSRSSTGE